MSSLNSEVELNCSDGKIIKKHLRNLIKKSCIS